MGATQRGETGPAIKGGTAIGASTWFASGEVARTDRLLPGLCFRCHGFYVVGAGAARDHCGIQALAGFRLSLASGGLIATATLLGVGVSSVFVGWLSDNYGRRPALIGSLFVFALLTAAIALARSWEDLVVLRFLAGLGLGGVWGVAAAFVNETWPVSQRGRAAAFVLSSWPIGFGAAAFAAFVIMPTYGWRGLFLSGLVALVAAVYALVLVPESRVWKESHAVADQNRGSRVRVSELFDGQRAWITVFGTATSAAALIGYRGANTWMPTYLAKERHFQTADVTLFLVLLNAGMFAGYQVFGWLGDRNGRERALIGCFVGAACVLPIFSLGVSARVLFLIAPLVGLFLCYTGVFGAYFAELYPARIRSLGAGFCFNGGRGISAFAPALLGEIAAKTSLGTAIALCSLGFLIAAIFTTVLGRAAARQMPS